jgi:predicted DNA-binding protein with PD1-like motif
MDARNDGTVHLVRLDRGESIMQSLLRYAKEADIQSGFLTGIGATSFCEIGYFDLDAKQYLTKKVEQNCEVVGVIGNIAGVGGEPMIHAHITLGFPDYHLEGGHLVEGTISVTGEFWIHPAGFPVSRSLDAFSGLKLIDLGAQ